MTDPYAPQRRRVMTDHGDQLATFTERLIRLGAPPDVVQAVRDHWAEGDLVSRDEVLGWSDDQLRRELRAVLDEHEHDTTTEQEQAVHEWGAIFAHVPEAVGVIAGNVPSIAAWIGDDRARAVAAWATEHKLNDPPRKGVVSVAETIAPDWLDRFIRVGGPIPDEQFGIVSAGTDENQTDANPV